MLLGWLHNQLGYESTVDILKDTNNTKEGFGADGRSYVYYKLISNNKLRIDRDILKNYDRNIHEHLDCINTGRSEPVILKYFQYLAVLYAEIFLDNYFNRRDGFLLSLNKWIKLLNDSIPPGLKRHKFYNNNDLGKMAFWMATGSGKTIIMHINYLQFMHYNTKQLDNVLLVTPNEGLSEQHIRELGSSNIRAGRFTGSTNNQIDVIEITKLKPEKSGKGKTVQADAFGGNNLIFVDEGHKGYGGESWLEVRGLLGKTGFTFEYSATFGQALGAAKAEDRVEEYGRSIIFDYSYSHFYHDGYGKDFDIINMEEDARYVTDTLLLANLLSFYEQRLIFDEHAADLQQFNLDRPLWMFVGSRVNAVHMEGRKPRSDILTIVRFLHRLLTERKWAENVIKDVLGGKSGLNDNYGNDIFQDKFGYLREHRTGDSIYNDILKRILHADYGGGLHLHRINGVDGEMGLKAAGSKNYFGVISVGDINRFEKLVESDGADVIREHDAISGSLFEGINSKHTTIEVLIGAKKFMEGWNSWRVSAMGLLNLGRSEGSQIVQLFGRGVRLRGRDMSLKRSSAMSDHPDYVRNLEILNIFALRADYMAQFRDILEKEGAPVHGMVNVHLPIRSDHTLLGGYGLLVPCLPDDVTFTDEMLVLEVDKAVNVSVNMLPKITVMASSETGVVEASARAPTCRKITDLVWLDMSDIYVELLKRKSELGLHNMIVQPHIPEDILKNGQYKIVADDSVFQPRSHSDVQMLQEAATSAVLMYAEKFYKKRLARWESDHLQCGTLDDENANFQDYTITISGNDKSLITKIQNLVEECDQIYEKELDTFPNIHFDKHLYLPLLREPKDDIKISPPGLNEGEVRFVKDLREYCKNGELDGKELFLLRNQSRGKGIGFFGDGGIYPDFILWIKSGEKQRIVFVEPHGMYHEEPDKSDKVQLCSMMPKLTHNIRQQPGMANVTLDSYVISQTSCKDLTDQYFGDWNKLKFAQYHILFPEHKDYLSEIIHGTTDFVPYDG